MLHLNIRLNEIIRKPLVIVLIVFFVVNLRVVYWFQPGYPVFEGDVRPPIVPNAYVTRSVYVFNEIDFGVPSVFFPRLIDPFFSMIFGFQQVGVNIYFSEMLATYFTYMLVSVLVFFYVKNLLRGDVLSAFVAALFFTSNLYLLVDTQTSAISYMATNLTIFPCLTAFAVGLKRKSLGFMWLAGFLLILTYATFPNYRALAICVIMLLVTLLAIEGRHFLRKQMAKYLVTFAVSTMVASIWMVTFAMLNWQSFSASYNQPSNPVPFLSIINQLDIPRLITKWTFFPTALNGDFIGALNMIYVPYSVSYFSNIALRIISYLPVVFAFSAVAISRCRKHVLFFAGLAIIFLVLTTGFTASGNGFYNSLVDTVPLMKVFREQASWTFFVVLFYGILIGMFTSGLLNRLKRNFLKIFAFSGIIIVMFATVYPMFTGEVTENWLDPKTKGSYIPDYFGKFDQSAYSDGWTLLLPQRASYVAYNFTSEGASKGVLNAGNPYPFLSSKPLIYGSGTEYIKSPSVNVINETYILLLPGSRARALGMLGIKYLLVENNTIFGNLGDNRQYNLTNFELVQEWEYASLYNNSYALPRVYSADIVRSAMNLTDMYHIMDYLIPNENQRTCFVMNDTARAQESFRLPEGFSFVQKTPVEYEATANASYPFVLVLLNNYDSDWKVYVNGTQVSDNKHFVANGYANGWVVDENLGRINIQILYAKQSLVVDAVVVSVVVTLVMTLVVWKKLWRNVRLERIFGRQVKSAELPKPILLQSSPDSHFARIHKRRLL